MHVEMPMYFISPELYMWVLNNDVNYLYKYDKYSRALVNPILVLYST